MSKMFKIIFYCSTVSLTLGQTVEPVNLGSMESWGFNGVSSDEVLLLSERKMKINNLEYTGEGPAAWFMIGKDDDDYTQEFTDLDGVIIPDENGGCDRLGRYRGDDIELTLPAGLKFTDYDYLSIYCIRFSHNFGYIPIKKGIVFTTLANTTTATATAATATATAAAPVATPQDAAAPVENDTGDDDLPGECDQEPERRNNRPGPPLGPPGSEEEEEE